MSLTPSPRCFACLVTLSLVSAILVTPDRAARASFVTSGFTFTNGAAGSATDTGIPGTTDVLQITFTAFGTPGSGSLDVHYTIDSDPTTLIRFAGSGAFITNQTGYPWTDVTVTIVSGSSTVTFNSEGTGLDFPNKTAGLTTVDFFGPPGLANGSTTNSSQAWYAFLSPSGPGDFDLIITPTAVLPEPSSLALLAVGLAACLLVYYRTRFRIGNVSK